jgi:DNA-binding NarL/FixJ family response regulator
MKTQKSLNTVQQVVILSEDIFSRNWMAQLIMRDWRTQVMGEAATLDELQHLLKGSIANYIDVLIVDVDNNDADLLSIIDLVNASNPGIMTILISKRVDPDLLLWVHEPNIGGYLIKEEVEITLAWAVVKSVQGYLVLSKQIESLAIRNHLSFDKNCIVLDGIEASEYLSPAENQKARLAFVVSMSRGNLADELILSPNSSMTLVSNLYNQIGMNDLLNGDDWIQFNIDECAIILSHLEKVNGGEKFKTDKHSAKETLAFHIYTKPKIHPYAR